MGPNEKAFREVVKSELGNVDRITRAQVKELVEKHKLKMPMWLTNNPLLNVSRGVYSLALPKMQHAVTATGTPITAPDPNPTNDNSDPLLTIHVGQISMDIFDPDICRSFLDKVAA